jgi:hypothetical protein
MPAQIAGACVLLSFLFPASMRASNQPENHLARRLCG